MELTGAAGFGGDGFLSLTLGTDEQHAAAVGDGFHDFVVGGAVQLHGLLEVDDMDTVTGAENERAHFGVPTAGLVTEMDAGFQHLLHANVCHGMSPSTWGFASTPALTLLPVCLPRTHAAGRNEHPRPLPECA